jgi:hypothetical protein
MSELYQSLSHSKWDCKYHVVLCQPKVEMSCLWQSRNVAFDLAFRGVHVNLCVQVKRRRAMLAGNPIKE